MSRKYIFNTILAALGLLIIVTEPVFVALHKNIFRDYEESHLEALFVLLVASALSVLVLFLQSKQFFQSWFKKFFIWYFPVAYGATFLFSTYGGITSTGRYEAAIGLGSILVLVTVVWSIFSYLKK